MARHRRGGSDVGVPPQPTRTAPTTRRIVARAASCVLGLLALAAAAFGLAGLWTAGAAAPSRPVDETVVTGLFVGLFPLVVAKALWTQLRRELVYRISGEEIHTRLGRHGSAGGVFPGGSGDGGGGGDGGGC